jgi:hypothetical protein
MAVLQLHRREAPKLPIEIFGEPWSRWIRDTAEGSACPMDYVAARCSLRLVPSSDMPDGREPARPGPSHRIYGAHLSATAATEKARVLTVSTGTSCPRSSAR